MAAVTRRRSRRDNEETDERDERPTRSRRGRSEEEPEERPSRRSRRSEPEEDEKPSRSRRSRSSSDEGEKPSRRRRGADNEDEGRGSRRRGTSGFGAYSSKKRASGGDFADEFKPGDNNKVLIKFLEDGPFDSYHQHWIDGTLPKDIKRRSYVCLDDEDYFDDTECPLCDIGEKAKTYALFNVIDFSSPRKPDVKVWQAPPAVADMLERASEEKKTSPINREDVYFEVERQKKGQKYNWVITPVKARDLPDDFDLDPLEEDEIEEFEKDMFEDRTAVTKVDDFDTLAELADDLMD